MYQQDLIRKTNVKDHLAFHNGEVPYFTFPIFDELGVKNGFSTKLGGVSTGCFAEMNLSPEKEDPAIIQENYTRICQALSMNVKHGVLTHQTHTVNIREVQEEDLGKGPIFPRDYDDVDGLVTNKKDVPLITLYADCVPLYFYDPIQECIGLSHSGWRGTVHQMGAKTIEKLKTLYGSDPKNIRAAIGPSICKDCYEIGEEVAIEFEKAFKAAEVDRILFSKGNGKYQLDLWEANKIILLNAEISEDHLCKTDICTKCNSNLLYSHRILGNRRGTLGAFLSL